MLRPIIYVELVYLASRLGCQEKKVKFSHSLLWHGFFTGQDSIVGFKFNDHGSLRSEIEVNSTLR